MTGIDLDKWAAELCGYKLKCSPDCIKYPLPYCENENGIRFSFRPSSPDAPAWQILAVIEAMRKEGFILHFQDAIYYEAFFDNKFRVYESKSDLNNPFITILRAAYAAKEGKS